MMMVVRMMAMVMVMVIYGAPLLNKNLIAHFQLWW